MLLEPKDPKFKEVLVKSMKIKEILSGTKKRLERGSPKKEKVKVQLQTTGR